MPAAAITTGGLVADLQNVLTSVLAWHPRRCPACGGGRRGPPAAAAAAGGGLAGCPHVASRRAVAGVRISRALGRNFRIAIVAQRPCHCSARRSRPACRRCTSSFHNQARGGSVPCRFLSPPGRVIFLRALLSVSRSVLTISGTSAQAAARQLFRRLAPGSRPCAPA